MQFGSIALLTALAAFVAMTMRHPLFLPLPAPLPGASSSAVSAVPSPWSVRSERGTTGLVRVIEGFEAPYGLAVLDDGTLFVMDALRGQAVRFSRSLSPLGVLDATADPSEFLHSIARAADGTFLLSEHRKGWVRRYADDGTVLGYFFANPEDSTLAFVGPVHVFVDNARNIWITDYRAHRVFKFDERGTFLGWIGATTEGGLTNGFARSGLSQESASVGGFNSPHMTTVDRAGNFYVIDTANHRVQKFSPEGMVLGWIGARGDGTVTDGWEPVGISASTTVPGGFQRPTSVTLAEGTSADDVLIVADTQNNRIQKFHATTGRFLGWMGKKLDGTVTHGWEREGNAVAGSEVGAFESPFGAQIVDGNLYVADRGNKRVQIIPMAR